MSDNQVAYHRHAKLTRFQLFFFSFFFPTPTESTSAVNLASLLPMFPPEKKIFIREQNVTEI